MERYKKLHLWLIVPLVIIQVGIFNYYWPKFTNVTWEIHFHYWLVTFWYILVIIQPYLAVNGKIPQHRTLGIFGFLLAGGVIFTGFSLLDIPLRILANADPNRPGPPEAFYYGTIIVEFLLMVAFIYAVCKSIIHRKNLHEHAWWLICSLFYMMMPALGRGMIVFLRKVMSPENFKPMYVFIASELIYIPLFILFIAKFGKWKHQATIIGFLLIGVRFLRVPLGSSETIQEFLKAVIQF